MRKGNNYRLYIIYTSVVEMVFLPFKLLGLWRGMVNNYLILEKKFMFNMFNNGFLRLPHAQHNPCYRKVITYGYFMALKKNNLKAVESEFTKMIEALDKDGFFNYKGWLEIYPTSMEGGMGCIVVEPSRNCFPLVVYPSSHTKFENAANKTRTSGFKVAIGKLQKNRPQIFALLGEYNEWTHELEKKLEPLFEYPKKKGAANSSDFNGGNKKKAA